MSIDEKAWQIAVKEFWSQKNVSWWGHENFENMLRKAIEAYEAAKAPVIEKQVQTTKNDTCSVQTAKNGDSDVATGQPDDCRKAFEVWARSKSYDLFGYGINGHYHDGKTDRAWEAWSYSWDHRQPEREANALEQNFDSMQQTSKVLVKRLRIAIGTLRSIAYGDANTWPNCSSREVAKQGLNDCDGEKSDIRRRGRDA